MTNSLLEEQLILFSVIEPRAVPPVTAFWRKPLLVDPCPPASTRVRDNEY